jgi:hypothetical protein
MPAHSTLPSSLESRIILASMTPLSQIAASQPAFTLEAFTGPIIDRFLALADAAEANFQKE